MPSYCSSPPQTMPSSLPEQWKRARWTVTPFKTPSISCIILFLPRSLGPSLRIALVLHNTAYCTAYTAQHTCNYKYRCVISIVFPLDPNYSIIPDTLKKASPSQLQLRHTEFNLKTTTLIIPSWLAVTGRSVVNNCRWTESKYKGKPFSSSITIHKEKNSFRENAVA